MKSWLSRKSSSSHQASKYRKRLRLETLEDRRLLAVIWVSTTGDDGGAGTSSDPFATIQRAIDEADELVTPGADTINVRRGTYVETVDIDDADPLEIKGIGVVTVDGDGDGSVFTIFGGHVTLKNLNITGGGETASEFGDGIEFAASTSGIVPGTALILDHIDSFGNDPVSGPFNGWGVFTSGVEAVQITNSSFDNNTVGIGIFDADTADVSRTSANENQSTGVLTDNIGTQNFFRVEANSNGIGVAPLGGDGFDLTGDTINLSFVTASDNLLTGALALDSGTINVNNGTFESNGVDGIGMIDVEFMFLTAVQAHDNGIDGVFTDGVADFLQLTNVKANGNGDDGVDASALDAVDFKSGILQGNGDDGVNVDDVLLAILDGIEASGNGNDGIAVGRALAAEILNSRSNDNDDDGFDLEEFGIVVLDNVVARGNDEGVSADGGGSLTIQGSQFIGNRAGVEAFGVLSVILDSVVARNNTENGVLIEGDSLNGIFTEVEVLGGNYSRNGLDGINIFEGGDVFVSRVLLLANVDDGLDISSSGLVTLVNVNATLNGDEDIIII